MIQLAPLGRVPKPVSLWNEREYIQKAVTYCNTGIQASHAYFTLKYLDYDVKMYDGSFTEWSKAEGTSTVTGKERK